MDQRDPSAEIATPLGSPISSAGLPDSVRRSARTKNCVHKYEDEDFVASPSKEASLPGPRVARTSRPKRKAAAAAADLDVTEDGAVLLDQIVAHVTAGERSEYKGWVELESEPVSLTLYTFHRNMLTTISRASSMRCCISLVPRISKSTNCSVSMSSLLSCYRKHRQRLIVPCLTMVMLTVLQDACAWPDLPVPV